MNFRITKYDSLSVFITYMYFTGLFCSKMTVFHEVSMLILMASTICILPQTSQELVDDPTGTANVERRECWVNLLDRNECLLCKKPNPQQDDNYIAWKFGNDLISFGTRLAHTGSSYAVKSTQYGEIQLTILKITEHNVGSYTCYYIPRSTKEQPLITYNIILQDKPNIIEHSNKTTIVSEGGTAELWCNATSPIPAKNYNTTWFIHSNKTDRPIGITGNKLEIVNITRHCGATYRCVVQNKKGKTHLDFLLVVQFKPHLKIEIKKNGEETIQENNVAKIVTGTNVTNVIIKCLVIAEPDINSIQWYKADNLIGVWSKTTNIKTAEEYNQKYSLMKEKPTEEGKSALVLNFSATDEDLDTFKCLASNNIGTLSTYLTLVKL